MAVKGRRVSVTVEPTRLTSKATGVGEHNAIYLKNRDASSSVDVGGDDVATGEGYELKAGEGISIDLEGRDAPFAVAASGTVRVDVIEGGI